MMGEYNHLSEENSYRFRKSEKKKKRRKEKNPARVISAFQPEFISVQGKDKFETYCRTCVCKYIYANGILFKREFRTYPEVEICVAGKSKGLRDFLLLRF